jgi:23S rRNA (uracil1939-C5)-methyltransferase
MKKSSSAPHGLKASGDCARQGSAALVESLGSQGHGIVNAAGGKLFVPFTLPGEHVLLEEEGGAVSAAKIEDASPERATPVCRHYGICGGCSLQHWKEEPYLRWKENLITAALARAGVKAPPIEPMRTYPVSSRRRATLTALRQGGTVELGYQEQRSHRLVDLAECPILVPALADALAPLKAALEQTLAKGDTAKVHMTSASNGLDCAVQSKKSHGTITTEILDGFLKAGFIRLTWNGSPMLVTAKPVAKFDEVPVSIPAAAFLQAVEACEKDMADWITRALFGEAGGIGPVCDLFAGLGAFSFPAARFGPVTVYEGNAAAAEALRAAAKGATGRKPVTAVRRDLFRDPLGPLEINKFAAVIMDPPREGARAQCGAIAGSKASRVAMISCNPAAFARDSAVLASSGFRINRLAAFDQFRFSAHVEIAALFERQAGKKGG